MPVYTKHGHRLTNETAHIDGSCFFADQVIKIRAVPENLKKERVFWIRDLLADNGKPEIEAFVKALKQRS